MQPFKHIGQEGFGIGVDIKLLQLGKTPSVSVS
jgi:hypothetical protein